MNPRLARHLVLAISGLTGWTIGLREAEWQWAIELAQLQAGLVHYPADAMTTAVQANLWSVVHQVAGVALSIGVPEHTACLMLSGILGLVAYQALAMLTLALTESPAASLLIIPLAPKVFMAAEGAVYPLLLLSTPYTYGALGLTWALLSVGLICAGGTRSGAVMLGLAPAVHAPLGFAAWAFAAIALAWKRSTARSCVPSLRWFVSGVALTLGSLALHAALRPALPTVDPDDAAAIANAFIATWDGHRQPHIVESRATVVALVLLAASVMALAMRTKRPPGTDLLLRFILIAATAGLALAATTLVPVERWPSWFVSLMPGRFISIALFTVVPVMLWLATRGVERITGGRVQAGEAVLLKAIERIPHTVRSLLVVIAAVTSTTIVLRSGPLRPVTASPVLHALSARTGTVASASGIWLVPAMTRRPVLLDVDNLDTLAYAREGGPFMDRVLRDVYEVDIRMPAPTDQGRFVAIAHREAWERRPRAAWQQLRARYGIVDVITFADWRLDLPLVVEDAEFRLYTIPR